MYWDASTKVSYQQSLVDPKMAEAMSAHHVGAPSSPLCKRGWFLCCAFLGDALQVIQALSAAPPHLHSIGYFVESIHQELRPSCDDPFFFIYTKHFININLLKYNWIFTVARRYVAKPTYGTYPIICTWQIRV